ncbi:MAG: glycosyltransferase family 39 protein [Acidobacteria bacterium]|nr:glycosyltransferase family 39 protein [Acidobacteriota bacterium]
MQTIIKYTAGSAILLTAISLATLFFRLGSLPLVGADEPRYARIAEEMHQQGAWVTPTLENKPWLEKPPLYYWITIPFYSLLPNNETAARLGPALSALITALAVFWLGAILRNRLAGFLAASILLTSLGFILFGRGASTDMPFTCAFTLGMTILAAAVRKDPGIGKIMAAYIFFGLAVLGKGPVAIILAVGIGILFWYFNERGHVLSRWRILAGFFILILVCAPWFCLVFKQNGYAFIATFFVNHNIARFVTGMHHHSQPFYYFLPVLLALFFPWSGWLPLLIPESPLEKIRRWRDWDPVTLFLACWLLFPLLFFSLSDSKLPGYILPSIPPLALLLGIRLSHLKENPVRPAIQRTGMILILTFSIITAAAAPYYFQTAYGGNWRIGILLSVVFFLPALTTVIFGFRGRYTRAYATTVLQGILIVITAAQFAIPVLGQYHSTRDIAQLALEARKGDEPIITYGFTHHSLHYYTGYQVHGKIDNSAMLPHILPEYEQYLVITKENKVQDIRNLQGMYFEILGEQGPFRLLRLSRN